MNMSVTIEGTQHLLSGHSIVAGFPNLNEGQLPKGKTTNHSRWGGSFGQPRRPGIAILHKKNKQMQLLHGYSLLVTSIGNGKKEGLKHAWRFNDFKEWSCPSGQAKNIKNLCSSVLSQASYSNDCAKYA